jgi:hypothetical protein
MFDLTGLKNNTLKDLEIKSPLTKKEAEKLEELLKTNQSVRRVIFTGEDRDPFRSCYDIPSACKVLSTHSFITHFEITPNVMAEIKSNTFTNTFKCIIEMVKTNKYLETLILQHHGIKSDLAKSNLDDLNYKRLAESLTSHPSIKTLKIRDFYGMSDRALKAFESLLFKLVHVDIGGRFRDLTPIAQAIKNTTTMKTLLIQIHNGLYESDEQSRWHSFDVKPVFEALINNPTLHTFGIRPGAYCPTRGNPTNFNNNETTRRYVSDEAMSVLNRVATENRTLRFLLLEGQQISGLGGRYFSGFTNHHLVSINLNKNEIFQVNQFFEMLLNNYTLTSFDLSENKEIESSQAGSVTTYNNASSYMYSSSKERKPSQTAIEAIQLIMQRNQQLANKLKEAVGTNDMDTVRNLLALGVSPYVPSLTKDCSTTNAILNQNEMGLGLIGIMNKDYNTNQDQNSPLQIAVQQGFSKMVALLLANGALDFYDFPQEYVENLINQFHPSEEIQRLLRSNSHFNSTGTPMEHNRITVNTEESFARSILQGLGIKWISMDTLNEKANEQN